MPLKQLGPRCAVASLLVGLAGCPGAEKGGEETGTASGAASGEIVETEGKGDTGETDASEEPVYPVDTGDTGETGASEVPLEEALACPGLAEPMAIESEGTVLEAFHFLFSLAREDLFDMEIRSAAEYLAGLDEAGCATYSVDAGTMTATGSCIDVEGMDFVGTFVSTSLPTGLDSSWYDLRIETDDFAIEGTGRYYAEELARDTYQFSIDRSWSASFSGSSLDGTYALQAEGVYGLPGEIVAGWLHVTESSDLPSGEMCFAMSCDSETFDAILKRKASPEAMEASATTPECRFLVQGDSLWEFSYHFDEDGRECRIITVDGEMVFDTCY